MGKRGGGIGWRFLIGGWWGWWGGRRGVKMGVVGRGKEKRGIGIFGGGVGFVLFKVLGLSGSILYSDFVLDR